MSGRGEEEVRKEGEREKESEGREVLKEGRDGEGALRGFEEGGVVGEGGEVRG